MARGEMVFTSDPYKVVPSERFIAFSWGPHNSNFTMVYGRYLYLLWFINQL